MTEDEPYVPSATIFKEILFGIVDTWHSCEPWGISMAEVEIIFYICCMFLVFYFYVMAMIIRCIWKNPRFRNPFYYCSVVLAVGDILTLITCAREGAIQSCVLSTHPSRHMAWESIGGFCVDLIFTVNLVMALVRLNAIVGIARHSSPKIKATRSFAHFKREYRFLLLAGLIFLSELVNYYCTDWVGSLIFNWGSDEFNAKLNYFLRPVTTGITPMFYLIFSVDLRHACLHPLVATIPKKITPVSSATGKKTGVRNLQETIV